LRVPSWLTHEPSFSPFLDAGVTLTTDEIGQVETAFGGDSVDFDALLQAILS
jgi:hypothetical protein